MSKVHICRESMNSLRYPTREKLRRNRLKLIKSFVNKLRSVRNHQGRFRFLRKPRLWKNVPMNDEFVLRHPGCVCDTIVCEVIFD